MNKRRKPKGESMKIFHICLACLVLVVYCRVDAKTCPVKEVVNMTETWNDTDTAALKRATIRCVQLYPRSPCLKKFVKVEFNNYHAICGKAEEDQGSNR